MPGVRSRPGIRVVQIAQLVLAIQEGHGRHGMHILGTGLVELHELGNRPEPHAERGGFQSAALLGVSVYLEREKAPARDGTRPDQTRPDQTDLPLSCTLLCTE